MACQIKITMYLLTKSNESEQLHKWSSNSNIIITSSFDILQIKQIVYWYQECTKKWLTASKVLSTLRPVTRIKRIPAAKHAKSTQRFGLFPKPVQHKNCDRSCTCCTLQEHAAFNQNPWHVTSYRNLSCLIVVNNTAALFF